MGRIFNGKQAGQPAIAVVVNAQRRLQTGELRCAGQKGRVGLAQLARIRPVFSVIDNQQLASAQRQGIIQRLRLGSWQAGWHGNDRDKWCILLGQHTMTGGNGIQIIGLKQQFDLQLFLWPVEPRQGSDQIIHLIGLLVERHKNRIGRQAGIGQPVLDCSLPRFGETGPARQAQAGLAEIGEQRRHMQGNLDRRVPHQADGRQNFNQQNQHHCLGKRYDLGCRQIRPLGAQLVAGLCHQQRLGPPDQMVQPAAMGGDLQTV